MAELTSRSFDTSKERNVAGHAGCSRDPRQIRTLSRSARQSHGDVVPRPESPVPTSFTATGTRRPVLASTNAREPMGCLRLTVTRSLHDAEVLPAGAAALS